MTISSYIIELIETKAKAKGLSIQDACRLAKVRPATFSQWRQGHCSPTASKAQQLLDAIEKYQPQRMERCKK